MEKKESVKPERQYSEIPGVYYWFCGSCGNGIEAKTTECPFCHKQINWVED